MKNLLYFILKNRRSLFFSITLGLGAVFSIEILKDYGTKAFLVVNSITILILIFEIYLDWHYATKVLRQIDMPSINAYNLAGHIINHITLPLLLYISLVGFVYFNIDDLIRLIIILIVTFVNTLLFINIRSYYEDDFNLDYSTRYIYDVIKLIVFFLAVNVILHLKLRLNIDVWVISILIYFLVLLLSFLIVYRQGQIGRQTFTYISITSFLIAVLFMILNIFEIFLIGTNVITFLLFYFDISILQHKLNRDLTFNILVEYILTLFLAIILFSGIS